MKKRITKKTTIFVVMLSIIGSIIFIYLLGKQIFELKFIGNTVSVDDKLTSLQNNNNPDENQALENNQILIKNTTETISDENIQSIKDADNDENKKNESTGCKTENIPGNMTETAIDILKDVSQSSDADINSIPEVGFVSKEEAEKSIPEKPDLTPPSVPGTNPTPPPEPKPKPTPQTRTTVPDSENPFLNVPDGKPIIEDGSTEHGTDGSGDKF